jgi:chemotaxis protein histidine kinase CheA
MASLEKLRFRAHTLAGAGGTFQCWEVSEAAAALDSELRALVRTGRKVDPRRIDRLGKFVRTLLDALDRAESGTGATGCSEA